MAVLLLLRFFSYFLNLKGMEKPNPADVYLILRGFDGINKEH
jgi:hypothetical protein